MRRNYGRRVMAFVMAFIMALSVVFQGDGVIGGLAQAFAAQTQERVATPTDAYVSDDEETAVIAADDVIDLEADGYTINTGAPTGRTYSGEPLELISLKVKSKTNTVLDKQKYTVKYLNNINVGTATVIVTGNEEMNCTGTLTATFQIKPITINNASRFYLNGTAAANKYSTSNYPTYKYEAGGVLPKVYVKKLASTSSKEFLVEGQDYEVEYYNTDEASDATPETDGNGPRIIVTSLSPNYKIGGDDGYYIYYGITASKLDEQTVDVVLEGDTFEYSEYPIEPNVDVIDKSNGKSLYRQESSGVGKTDYDYAVEYSNNTGVGTATITITGAPKRFPGTITKTFQIVEAGSDTRKISDAEVTIPGTFEYDDTYKKPEPVVTYNGETLTKGVDYTVGIYSNNKNATSKNSMATVTISGKGKYVGSKTVEFEILPRSVEHMTIKAGDAVYDTINNKPEAVVPSIVVRDEELDKTLVSTKTYSDYVVDYNAYRDSNDFNVGSHTMTLKGYGNYTGIRTFEFNIVARDISDAVIKCDPAEYTGQPVEPEPSSVTYSGTTLVKGKDYKIKSYSNNTELGDSAVITIEGIGNFKGTATGKFTISTSKISMNDVTMSEIAAQTYTGDQIKPDFTLTYNDYTLVENTDYTVEYGENLNTSKNGTLKITGIGQYAGTISKTFRIKTKGFSDPDIIVKVNRSVYKYTGDPIKPDITVLYHGHELEEVKDYIFSYTVDKFPADPGTYNLILFGKGNFSTTAKIVENAYTITAPSGDMTKLEFEDIPDQYYTGEDIVPDLTIVYDGSYTLKKDTDYTVKEIHNNRNVGTATITVEGAGSYKDLEKTLEFRIVAKPLDKCVISGIDDEYSYAMGDAIEPYVTITNGNVELEQDVDFTVTYENNVNVKDEPEVRIEAKSENYEGQIIRTFKITPVNIVKSCSTNRNILAVTQYYTGDPITPSVSVYRMWQGSRKDLVADTDYEVVYGNNTEVGEQGSITITGIDNFTGKMTVTFPIAKREIRDCDVEAIPDQQWTGEEIKPDVVITNHGRKLTPDEDYTVTYSKNVDVGTATATIKGLGEHYTGTHTLQFTITKEFVNIENNDKLVLEGLEDQTYNFGDAVTPDFTLSYDGETMTSGDYDYAFDNNTDVGEASLTVTGKGKYSGTVRYTFAIKAYDISEDKLVLSIGAAEYTGKEIKPVPAAINVDGENKVIDFTGFDVTYGENTEVGTGSVTITSKKGGNYTGSLTQTFVIYKKDITGAKVEAEDVTYTGEEQKPAVTVTCKDGTVVPKDSYTVAYTDNKEAGTAKIIVTAKEESNYGGEAEGTFRIKALDLGLAEIAEVENQIYTGDEIKPAVSVVYNGEALVPDKDYEISGYKNNTNVTTESVKAEITVKGIGRYEGTQTVKFDILPASIDGAVVDGYEDSVTYTGAAIGFESLSVTVDGRTLVNGTDYEVKYENNTNASTDDKNAKIIITAKDGGNYTGEVSREFTILPKSIEECEVGQIDGQIYTGSALNPDVVVKDGSRTLVSGTDYSVSYKNNTAVTTTDSPAVATITGKGNYAGSVQRTFAISKQIIDISGAEITITDKGPFVYNFGSSIEPSVSVMLGGKKLDAAAYTVSYKNNTNAGEASIIITGNDEYTGTASTTFRIQQFDVSKCTLVLESDAYEYTGSQISPAVTAIMAGDKEIAVGKDFSTVYSGNTNVGTGKVTLTARTGSNYTGSVSGSFTITAVNIENAEIAVADQTYTGTELTPLVTVKLGGKTLTRGTDYEVSFKNNINAGTAQVIVNGTGNYAGTASSRFEIAAKLISSADVSAPAQVYTGSELEPKVTVTMDGSVIPASEYDVSYSNNTEKGTAVITVTGKHNYKGTASGAFTISAMDISGCLAAYDKSVAYNAQEQEPVVVISNGDIQLEKYTDYDVTYKDNRNVTTADRKAQIIVTGLGNYSGQRTLTFDIMAADIEDALITGVSEGVQYTGTEISLSGYELRTDAEILKEGRDYIVTYDNNTEVGKATITFTGAGNYKGSVARTFMITRADIVGCTVDQIQGQIWTGSEVKPDVVVRNGDVVLKQDVDYTVAYEDNTDVTDSARVIITGKGNYFGERTEYFTISREVVDINEAAVAKIKTQVYALGQEIRPSVTVVYSGMTLKEGEDYTLTYKNNVNVGTASVEITGKGYYNNTKTVSFTISAFDVSAGMLILDSDSVVYTGSAVCPEVTEIRLADTVITDLDSFDVIYEKNVDAGTATVTVKAKENSNYTGSLNAEFTITRADLSKAIVKADDAVYQNKAVETDATVILNGKTLVPDQDYEVTFSENTNAGVGRVHVAGIGNYTGSVDSEFNITRRSITGADVEVADQVYTGSGITPEVKVTLSGTELKADVDYTVEYDKNINVGTAVVVVTGQGNYKDSVQGSFRITAAQIAGAEVSDIDDEIYTGDEIRPAVTVTLKDGTELSAGSDYDITYADNINVTSDETKARVIITGKGSYTGVIRKEFNILPKNISGAEISGYSEVLSYTGKNVTFDGLVVEDNGHVLINGTDYTVTYTGNKDVTKNDGTYFTVTGKGNYTGSQKILFVIEQKDLSECEVHDIGSQEWTGKAVEPDVVIKNGSVQLVNGIDYSISYEFNTAPTTDKVKAKAVITGQGNYKGTVTKEFIIARELTDISKAAIADIEDQTYAFGREIKPAIKVSYNGTELKQGTDYTVVYYDNVNAGTARVVITGIEGYNKTAEKTFQIRPVDISGALVTLKDTSLVYTGKELKPAVVQLSVPDGSDTQIIHVLTDFITTYNKNTDAGTAEVLVSAEKCVNYTGTARGEFIITKMSIADAVIETGSAEYSGAAVIPEVNVVLGERELKQGVDYTVSGKNNVDAGENALITVTGTGNYTGVRERPFEILPRSIADGECTIPDQVYTGADITPDVTLKVGTAILVSGKDYTVSYEDNRNVTTEEKKASAIIKAIGNYTGKLVVPFEITAREITAENVEDIEAQEYTGSQIRPSVVVKIGDTVLAEGRDYDVTYSNNVDKTDSAKAVVTGKGNYKGQVTKLFEICGASIAGADVSGIADSVVYTGKAIVFDGLKVMVNGNELKAGTDYTVDYENNINVTTSTGKAYVVIKGIGNFGGVLRKAFDITPKSLESCTVDDIGGQIYTGKEVTPEITVRDGGIILKNGTDYTLKYTNNTQIGDSAEVIVTGKGNYTGKLTATFAIAKEVFDISLAEIGEIENQYYNFGEEITPDVTVTLPGKNLKKDEDYRVIYTSNTDAGMAVVTVRGINQNKGEATKKFRILPIDITNAKIALGNNSYEYTGNAVAADVSSLTVVRENEERVLTELGAFTIVCSDNVNVGDAELAVRADGKNFTGSTSVSYKIVPASMARAEVTVDSAVYTGKAISPVCHVVLDGKTLAEGIDYTVTASGNVNAGKTAVAVISGKGNYTGSKKQQFTIAARKLSGAVVTAKSAEYTGQPVSTDVTVVLDAITLKPDVDYTLSYSDNVRATTGTSRAQVTVTGKGNYTGSTKGEFVINPKDIAKLSVDEIPAQSYDGEPVRPDVTVRDGDVILEEDTDYTLEYENNENVTTNAVVTITGCGNYTGKIQKTYVIGAYSIADADVSGVSETVVYTGDSVTFSDISVRVGGRTLQENSDYTVSYENNINVTSNDQKAYVVISGTGNYAGEVRIAFAITARNIARCIVEPVGGQIWTGSDIRPKVVVRDGARVLVSGKDYTVSYKNNTDRTDRAEILIEGIGNYRGSTGTTFTIAASVVDISKAVISPVEEQYYDFGRAIEPEVTVTYDGRVLTRNEDYELVYINNTSEGTATVQVNGINKNTGSVSTTFSILPVDISKAVVDLAGDSYEYTGQAVRPSVTSVTVKRGDREETVTSMEAFKVTYSNNIDVGAAQVTVTAKKSSGFTGSVSAAFEITQADMSGARVTVDDAEYTGKPVTTECTVILDGVRLVEGRDYTTVYSNNVNAGKSALITVKGAGNYKGEASVHFAISAKNISKAEVKVAEAVYTGDALTPAVSVVVDGITLKENVDYTINYSNNTDATTETSKASVVVRGTGNYEGTAIKTFDIAAKSLTGAVVNDIPTQRYTGLEIRPEVKVALGGKMLAAGVDYTITYENNIAVSDAAKVTVTGKGNYTGTIVKTFAIQNVTLDMAEITGIPKSVVYTGREITLTGIKVTIDGKELLEDEDYTISYSNNTNVTTKAEVIISGAGNYSGQVKRTFQITAKNIGACSVDAVNGQVYTGKAVTPAVTVRDGSKILTAGTDYKTAYSNNVNVTTSASMAVITITGTGNYTGSCSARFAISKKVEDISKATIGKVSDQLYNCGQQIKPSISVALAGKTLVNGTDYALVYVNNIDEGTATVIAKGINAYSGSVSTTFNIKALDISSAVIALGSGKYTYTGAAIKPDVTSLTVTRAGKKIVVTELDNVEIEYASNINAGTGTVTVTGLAGEGFTGSVKKTFTITGAPIDSAQISIDDGMYTGSEVKPSYTVTLNDKTLIEGTDYRVTFSNNMNVTNAAVIQVTGINNYTGTKSEKFAITPRSLADAVVTVDTARYTGQHLTPAVRVTLGSQTLEEDKDYTVVYSNNIDVTTDEDKAEVKITGIGNYTGTTAWEFDITPRDISYVTVSDIGKQSYTGSPIRPRLTVTDGEKSLKVGTDYTVTYRNNTDVTGSATVIIAGKGNYEGTVSRTFEIVAADISNAVVTGMSDSMAYTGRDITFAGLRVTYADRVLSAGTDYTVSYSGNRNMTDKAVVRILGNGNYTGSIIKSFVITRRDINDCSVGEIPGQAYTGQKIEPEITILFDDVPLVEDVDYEIAYSNNTEPTDAQNLAKAVITGKGNFAGEIEREFTITKNPSSIMNADISAIPDQVFAKKKIEPEVTVEYGQTKLVAGKDYRVSYANNYNAGTATVTVSGYGDYVGKQIVTFRINKRPVSDLSAKLTKSRMTYTGKAMTPGVEAIADSDGAFVLNDEEIAGFTVKYKDNVNAGTARAVITAGKSSNYSGSITAEFEIDRASIEDAEVDVEDVEYTGHAVIPDVAVTRNGIVLSEDDYTVKCDNNTEVGAADMVITGKGNYTGTITAKFAVKARSIRNCSISYNASAVYTGEPITPEVTVRNGSVVLVEGEDYVLSYDMNTQVTSRAKIVITGIGNYRNSVTRYFAINRRSIAGAEVEGVTGKTFTGNQITQNIKVVLDGETLKRGTDYTVKYADNVHAGTATVTISGVGSYTDTIKKSFAISRIDISKTSVVTGIPAEAVYTGLAIKFNSIKVTWGNKVLKAGTDYVVSYKNNSNVSVNRTNKASCIVKFIGDYRGSVTRQFKIKAYDISKVSVTASPVNNIVYTGKQIMPKVTVKMGNTVVNSSQYQVRYSNNIKPGIATITVTGVNNFYGTRRLTFNISPAKMTKVTYTGASALTASIKWDSVPYVTGYTVYRYDETSKKYVTVGSTSGTAYTVKNLSAGKNYKLAVAAYVKISGGKVLYGQQLTVNVATKTGKVTDLKCTAKTDKTVTITWKKVSGAQSYKVYRYDSKSKKYVSAATVKSSDNKLVIKNLSAGTAYKFRVNAYRSAYGKALESDGVEISVLTKPAAVTGLKVKSRSNGSITMKWNKVSSADGYIVYRYTGKTFKRIKTITSKNSVTFISSGLTAGTEYKYRVASYKKNGKTVLEGGYAGISDITLPVAPVVTAKAGSKKAMLAWRRVKGANGYVVYMSTSKKGTYKRIATLNSAKKVRYTKTKLKKGKTYYFKVRAYKRYKGKTYFSSYSTVRTAKVK